jgi:hypothetical protein
MLSTKEDFPLPGGPHKRVGIPQNPFGAGVLKAIRSSIAPFGRFFTTSSWRYLAGVFPADECGAVPLSCIGISFLVFFRKGRVERAFRQCRLLFRIQDWECAEGAPAKEVRMRLS